MLWCWFNVIKHDPFLCACHRVTVCHRVTDQIDAIFALKQQVEITLFSTLTSLYVQRCWAFPVCWFVSTFCRSAVLVLERLPPNLALTILASPGMPRTLLASSGPFAAPKSLWNCRAVSKDRVHGIGQMPNATTRFFRALYFQRQKDSHGQESWCRAIKAGRGDMVTWWLSISDVQETFEDARSTWRRLGCGRGGWRLAHSRRNAGGGQGPHVEPKISVRWQNNVNPGLITP